MYTFPLHPMVNPVLMIASENPGKLYEFQKLLADFPVTLIVPSTRHIHLQVEEDGKTYAENAALKALAYARASGLPALADDSGLEVDALDGRPGLYSHRFAPQPNATDADRRAYLLSQLKDLPRPWLAHFHCTIAVAQPDGQVFYADGDCPGEIIPVERGTHGFGYDPIFYLAEWQATMAELEDDAKNQVSHRGRAARAAIPILRSICSL